MMTSKRLAPIVDRLGNRWELWPWIAFHRVGSVVLTGRGYTEDEAIADLHDDPFEPADLDHAL